MFLLLVCGIVLLPKASTLTCHDCPPGLPAFCTDNITCPLQGSQCGSFKLLHYTNANKVFEVDMVTCLRSEHCVNGSINFGYNRTVFIIKCCSTDFCNSQPIPAPKKSTPNGRKCFTCDETTCKATLNCEGDEDHCVTATLKYQGVNTTKKGCASGKICTGEPSFKAFRPEVSCCQGNYCNSAIVRRTGLLLFVAPLIACSLFS